MVQDKKAVNRRKRKRPISHPRDPLGTDQQLAPGIYPFLEGRLAHWEFIMHQSFFSLKGKRKSISCLNLYFKDWNRSLKYEFKFFFLFFYTWMYDLNTHSTYYFNHFVLNLSFKAWPKEFGWAQINNIWLLCF